MDEKNSGTFTLINDKTGDKYTLPVISGTTGPNVIDVRRPMARPITSLLIQVIRQQDHANLA